MRRVPKPAPSHIGSAYEIDIIKPSGARITYATRRLISDFGVDAVCGRGTRVWSVVEKGGSNASELVLKDCWIDADRSREGVIVQLLRGIRLTPTDAVGEEARRLLNEEEEGRARFLDVVSHVDVTTSYQCGDQTRVIHRGGTVLTYDDTLILDRPIKPGKSRSKQRFNSQNQNLSAPSTRSLGGVPDAPLSKSSQTGSVDRNMQHYRIVFATVAKSLYDLTTFKDIFTCLLDAILGTLPCHNSWYAH